MERHIYKHIKSSKIYSRIKSINQEFIYLGELILVGALGFAGLMMAGTTNLPNNNSFAYPLKQVSTLECRTLYWNDMPDSCKIDLPIIRGANYSAYQDIKLYRDIYTVLRAAPYSDSWNQKIGAHEGLDIATARGTPLYSIGDGEVFSAGRNSAYGNLVRIKYIYKGEIVYAVYAHMDTINVKEGDKVSRGQKIGTVGNTGNTSGALGGYHVHFELTKDNFGRPAYAYTNCPDLSKGHYYIIQNGLCRNELMTYQYDPIKIFEAGSTYKPPVENKPVEEKPLENDEGNDNSNSGEVSTPSTENNSSNNSSSNNSSSNNSSSNNSSSNNSSSNNSSSNNSSSNNSSSNNSSSNNSSSNNSSSNNNSSNNNSSSNNGNHSSPSINNEKPNNNSNPTENNKANESENIEIEKDPLLIDLDFTGLRDLAEHFSRLWDVEMKTELKKRSLRLGETITLDVEIFKKGKNLDRVGNYFNGVLNVPFVFVLSNDSASTNINSLQLITKGKAKVEITGNKIGKSSLIIELANKKIGHLDIEVK
ncbi:MAG: M23 family metallopeptidase [Candidatus Absconditabacterales bacterium]|nr:M23 family metallopeptidase [Candidatus Absconditabacterales bacterium]